MVNNNLVIDAGGEITTVNLDQVRVCRFREDGSEASQMTSENSRLLQSHKSASGSSASGLPRDNFQPGVSFRT